MTTENEPLFTTIDVGNGIDQHYHKPTYEDLAVKNGKLIVAGSEHDSVFNLNVGEFMPARPKIELKVVNELIRQYGLPAYASEGDAGMDLRACIRQRYCLRGGETVMIETGIAVWIRNPEWAGFVASRSGLYAKHKVRVGQGFGTIDSTYHGEIKVLLHNDSNIEYTIEPGERIAQLIFLPVLQVNLIEVDEFSETTVRGTGGFGSTGKF
jgi:dUTP pyrophosphatase